MSMNHYHVEAVAPDGNSGDEGFIRATSVAKAEAEFIRQRGWVADWTLTTTRISREEFRMAPEPRDLIIPPINDVIAGADPDAPSDADDIAYNRYATDLVLETLQAMKDEGLEPLVRTQYPHDTVDAERDTRDLVTFDHRGGVAVLNPGDA